MFNFALVSVLENTLDKCAIISHLQTLALHKCLLFAHETYGGNGDKPACHCGAGCAMNRYF